MSATLLIADDDLTIRTVLGKALTRQGFNVRTTAHAATLWHWASNGEGDLIITDVMMPDGDGLELVPSLQRIRPDVKIIVISAQNSLSTAVKTQKLGVFGYLPKPFDLKELLGLVNSALGNTSLPQKSTVPKDTARLVNSDFPLVGSSALIQGLFRQMGKFASRLEPVLITGATGAGKSLAAEALLKSKVSGSTYTVHPATFDEDLPKLQAVRNGSVVFESVDALNSDQQQSLLAVLETGVARRYIATATNELGLLVEAGEFSRGLYDRLNVLQLHMPTLNERVEDIPLLLEHFLRAQGAALVFTLDAIEFLKNQTWHGNVRQLENVVTRLVAADEREQPSLTSIENAFAAQAKQEQSTLFAGNDIDAVIATWVERQIEVHPEGGTLHKQLLELLERPLIEQVMDKTRSNQIKAAAILGLNRNTLRKKIRELDATSAPK